MTKNLDSSPFWTAMRQYEKELLASYWERSGSNAAQAAEMAGLSKQTYYAKAREHGVGPYAAGTLAAVRAERAAAKPKLPPMIPALLGARQQLDVPIDPPIPAGCEPRIYSFPPRAVSIARYEGRPAWDASKVTVQNDTDSPATCLILIASPGVVIAETILRGALNAFQQKQVRR